MDKTLFKNISLLFFFFLLIFFAYSNTFHASWHMDDRPNIVNNYFLHLDSLDSNKIIKTFYTDTHNPHKLKNKMYRPVPCLTFALNWYFGKNNVFGYHIVNIVIHILTAFFLFLFIHYLFSTPNLINKFTGNPYYIAVFAALLWALNPIQTQTVTYIVQRMAQLAALFYILGMYAYIKGRLSVSLNKRIIWFICCAIAYVLAVYSKSNASMLPMAILLLEIIFFQNLLVIKNKKRLLLIAITISVSIILLGSFFFLNGDPLSFLNQYNGRTFTLTERLLAQPRVVLFYLSQIFYPTPDRFSIAHDIVLSSSLFEPWTTIPCILIILFLIGFAFWQTKEKPLLSFSILFFFLNHIIESSIIALEIIFEHRNYLPSFFLFLPLSYLLATILMKFKKNRTILFLTWFFILSLLTSFSVSTFIRNKAWSNDISLWTDAVAKAPNKARAANILAIKLAWGNNSNHPKKYDMALELLKTSLEKHMPISTHRADILGNMASIYFYNKNNHNKGISLYHKALKINPGSLKIRHDLAKALTLMDNFDDSLIQCNILISKNKKSGTYYNLKGHNLLWKKQYKEALLCFKNAYTLTSNKASIILNSSVALSLAGYHHRAESILVETIKQHPKTMTFYFAAIENSIRSKNTKKTVLYIQKLIKQFNIQEINNGLDTFTDNSKYAPISKKIISPAIENMLK